MQRFWCCRRCEAMNNKAVFSLGISLIFAALSYAFSADYEMDAKPDSGGVVIADSLPTLSESMSNEQISQSHEEADNTGDPTDDESFAYGLSGYYNSFKEEEGWLNGLWGQEFRDRMYLGMWTAHLSPDDDHQNRNNLFGITWNGLYGGTFINTWNDRVYSAGVQRALYRNRWHGFDIEAGYRLGMMYCPEGYKGIGDQQFTPLPQLIADIDYNGFGMQFSWAGVVMTAGFYYRF